MVTLINVGNGEETLIRNSFDQLLKVIPQKEPAVVNMSISYESDESPMGANNVFEGIVKNLHERTVLVVAAGNGGEDLSSHPIIPASMGGGPRGQVITVAAHDADGRLTAFSNYGAESVDIAAPGCEVPSWIGTSSETIPLSGTSMAAPHVSFSAALLQSTNQDMKGEAIRIRLVVSGDLLAPSPQAIAHGGIRLNAAKALLWFQDYVEVDGEQYLGEVRSFPPSMLTCAISGQRRLQDELWAIKRAVSGRVVMFLGRKVNQLLRPCESGDPDSGNFVFVPKYRMGHNGFEEVAGGAEKVVPFKSVREVVMASR
jgi:hypothetical protein